MKQKYAVGITVNGNEVRAAFLSLVRGKACIQALESTKLDTPLDELRDSEKKNHSLNDLEKAFDLVEPQANRKEERESGTETATSSTTITAGTSVSLVYSLLDRYQQEKLYVAINAPVLTVKYDTLDAQAVPKEKKKLKDRLDFWGNDEDKTRETRYLDIGDGKVLQVDYEYHPPIVDILDEVNQFRVGKFNLVLMDTNELALVDLVREIYKLKKDEITAVVYIEDDFSRIIFLKGKNIYHITPIIHKGSMSKDVLEVIYSRMIFAQDHHMIPELNKILVAGHSSKLKAKYYFRQKFPSAITGYLNSRKIRSNLRFKDRGLLFSRYAIPIALAWKALQGSVVKSKTNLLPEYLLERQKALKLAVHGYILLALVILSTFVFTYLIVTKNIEYRKVESRLRSMKAQLENNRALTDRVHAFDNRIIQLEKKVALVDSFSRGYTDAAEFLAQLSTKLRETGGIWLTDLSKQDEQVEIKGIASNRDRIPRLASELGGANLKKVTRSEIQENRVFTFMLDKKLDRKNGGTNRLLALKQALAAREEDDSKASGNGLSATNGGNGSAMQVHRNGSGTDPQVYALQVGVFASKSEAQEAAKAYKAEGYRVRIKPEGNQFALIIGAYDDKGQAEKTAELLSARSGIESQIVRLKK